MKVLRPAIVATGLMFLLAGCTVGGSGAPEPRPTSAQQASEMFLTCLNDLGWEARIDPADGGVIAEYPPEQNDRYLADSEGCAKRIGTFDPPALSDEQLATLREGLIESAACLEDLGYDVPPAPSKAVFIETKGQWSPYALLPDMSADEFNAATEACPQPQL